ncbi:MAG: MYXO-CTERM sorting domain-containing protein [Polyangiaceae bacterium]
MRARLVFTFVASSVVSLLGVARADIPPPDEQVRDCVQAEITKRIVAKDPALGPSPCRVVGPWKEATSPGEAASNRDAAQKAEGYTWICPLTRNYRGDVLYCKLPVGLAAEQALHGGGSEASPQVSPSGGSSQVSPSEATKVRGCGGCSSRGGSDAPLVGLGLVGLAMAWVRRRRPST